MPCQNVQHELNLDYDFPTALLSRGPTFKFVISLEMELLVLSIFDFGEIAFISQELVYNTIDQSSSPSILLDVESACTRSVLPVQAL